MNELQAQSLLIDAVRENEGFAMKMAHKFFAGIPDLFIKLPLLDPWFVEVKIIDETASLTLPVKLTPLQHKFLRDYADTGGNSGVAVFVRGKSDLNLIIVRYRMLMRVEAYAPKKWAKPLERGARNDCAFRILANFMRNPDEPR